MNTNGSMRNRVMIVNQVSLGRTKMMYEASHDMQHAPHLFNSVSRINQKTIILAHFFAFHIGYCSDICTRRQSGLSRSCGIPRRCYLCQCHNCLWIEVTYYHNRTSQADW
jgi:hypothetical protein